MIELKKCRDKIDALDRELLRLFEERMHIVKDVAYIKKANGIGICDSSREAELISAIKAMSEDGLSEYDKALFEKIMELSKLYQSRCLEE
ncbi:MAG: chorismate mutase [[Eubacterium] sulci]|nr:chorismate mutase [[Eubacterium] sulci]